MEAVLVQIQSWSGDRPYWLVNESECGLNIAASRDTMQTSSEHKKLKMDEQADRRVEELPAYQAGTGDRCIDVDDDDSVLLKLPGEKK